MGLTRTKKYLDVRNMLGMSADPEQRYVNLDNIWGLISRADFLATNIGSNVLHLTEWTSTAVLRQPKCPTSSLMSMLIGSPAWPKYASWSIACRQCKCIRMWIGFAVCTLVLMISQPVIHCLLQGLIRHRQSMTALRVVFASCKLMHRCSNWDWTFFPN